MTLEAYSADRLDELALRMLDCASQVRALANQARAEEVGPIELHDKKALEFLARLEDWIHKSEGTLAVAVRRAQGRRKAQATIGKLAQVAAAKKK